ncbi:MAG: hypothetical protein ACRDD1_21195, partial [Planctomycetia bacterium]
SARLGAVCVLLAAAAGSTARAGATNSAADVVPADVAFFSTSLHLKEHWKPFVESEALRRILAFSPVRKGLEDLKMQPQYETAIQMLELPLAQDLIAAGEELGSRELFVYGGSEWVGLVDLINDVYGQAIFEGIQEGMSGKKSNDSARMVRLLLRNKDRIKAPTLVFGGKVKDRRIIEDVLTQLKTIVENAKLPLKLEAVVVGEQELTTLKLTGAMIGEEEEEKFRRQLMDDGVTERQTDQFIAWMKEQTLSITVGVIGDYTVLSFGPNDAHLEKLGKGPSLADSPDVKPALAYLTKPNAAGFAYGSRAMAETQRLKVDELLPVVDSLLTLGQLFMPAELGDRLKADVHQLAGDVGALIPPASPWVQVQLLNKGIETYSFTENATLGIDYTKELSILKYAGPKPLFAAAQGGASGVPAYNALRGYAIKLFDYYRDFAEPQFEADMEAEAKKYEAIALPFLKKFDATTREKFLPAIDMGQTLFVVDFNSTVTRVGPTRFPEPMPAPSVSLGFTLNDSKLFLEAVGEYAEAIELLIDDVRRAGPDGENVEPFKFPQPETDSIADATTYFYELPEEFGDALSPRIVVGEKILMMFTSKAVAEKMTSSKRGPTDSVVAVNAPSGAVVVSRPESTVAALKKWVDHLRKTQPVDEESAALVDESIVLGFDLVGVYKGAAVRMYREDGQTVTHAWIHVEDLPSAKPKAVV